MLLCVTLGDGWERLLVTFSLDDGERDATVLVSDGPLGDTVVDADGDADRSTVLCDLVPVGDAVFAGLCE